MKKYLLFAGSRFYPSGGWNDFKGDHHTHFAAIEAAANLDGIEWWHVVEAETGKVVARGERK